jgi:hypothetical protein
MKMEDKLKELAHKRIEIAEYKARVKDAETQLQQYQPFIHLQNMKDHLKKMETEANDLTGQIKNEVEGNFVAPSGNKKPHDGIEIKKFQVVHMLDEDMAKEWLAQNTPNVLTIKKSKFNQIVKAVGGLKFVEINDEWRAQIASDLSMYEEIENEI